MGETLTTRRRWLQFGLPAMFVVVTICGIVAAWMVYEPGTSVPDLSKPVKEVRVSLNFGKWEMQITDPKLIQTLLAEPLGQARRDPHPAFYVLVGWAAIHYADGTEDGINLFLPWGRFKHGENYGIADFQLLQAEVKRSLPGASHHYFDRATP